MGFLAEEPGYPLPPQGNLTMGWDKSFADDLIVRLGAVSGRVALLLRSAEAKPTSSRFVLIEHASLHWQAEKRVVDVK